MEHNTLQGVIFDLDGTLLDSTGMWRQVDGRLMAHYGKEVPPDLSETVQRMSIEEFSQFFVEEFDPRSRSHSRWRIWSLRNTGKNCS